MPRNTRRHINIIFRDNGQGLTRDARLLAEILLSTGHAVTLTAKPPSKPPLEFRFVPEHIGNAAKWLCNARELVVARLTSGVRWDVNLFLESLDEQYFSFSRLNCFIPNQEWFTDKDRALMKQVDLVLFKTRHAEQLLRHDARSSQFIGFTSADRRLQHVHRDWNAAIHVAGWSPHKGTSRTLDAWSQHREWPYLTVIAQTALPRQAPNIYIKPKRIVDQALRHLQNHSGLHVCLSEVEGFGHSINEARSCGAIVMTTDAPPMNELIDPDTGILIPYEASEPIGAGVRYLFDRDGLSEAMNRFIRLNRDERQRLGIAARAAYEAGRSAFRTALIRVLDSA
jgi:glycosyltransferase involved in cell wall biosynthesis